MSVEDCLDGDITSQIRASYNDAVYVQQAEIIPLPFRSATAQEIHVLSTSR